MRRRKTIALMALSLAPLLIGPSSQAQTKVSGDSTNVGDVLRFLGIYSWKFRVTGSFRGIRAYVIHYERDARGRFQVKSHLGDISFSSYQNIKSSSLSFFWQEQGDSAIAQLSSPRGHQPPLRFPRRPFADYVKIGSGSGGIGLKADDEYILLAKYNNRRVGTDKKKDMAGYVSLRVSTSK